MPETVLSYAVIWKNLYNSCSILTVSFPYTEIELNSTFSLSKYDEMVAVSECLSYAFTVKREMSVTTEKVDQF